MHHETPVSSSTLYEGRIITVKKDIVRLENQQETTREVVVHNGGVCVAAIDDQDNLLFVRQFRYPYGQELLELPAGKREGNEAPADCGRRELEEETGFTAATFQPLATLYPTPAYCTEVIHIFYAADLIPSQQHLDENEFLDVEKLPFSQALDMVLAGQIPDAKTQLAILKLHALRTKA